MKILLLQLRRLGDLILTTPAIAALRQQLSESEITLAIAPASAALLPAIPGLSQSILSPGPRAWRQVRQTKFDCVVDFTANDRSAALTAISGAPRRLVSDGIRKHSWIRPHLYNEFVACRMGRMHAADYCLAMVQPFGLSEASPAADLHLPRAAMESARTIVGRELGDQPFVIFHPGSARSAKFWVPECWAEVITFTQRQLGLPAVLTGGRDRAEQAHLAQIHRHSQEPVFDLSTRLDLLTLAAIIARARLLVTVDSAPMHLAGAFRVPQVDLFGPTNPFHWRPRRSPAAILFGAGPEPISTFTPRAAPQPMNAISTEAVIDAMRAMLSAPTASAV